MKTVADRPKHFREQAKLSQGPLHTNTGLPQSTISNLENGIGKKTLRSIRILADYFGVSANYLLGLTDDPLVAGKASEIQMLYSRLSPDRQRDAIMQLEMSLLDESDEYQIEWSMRALLVVLQDHADGEAEDKKEDIDDGEEES